jgi:hypothetical protein
MYTIEQVQRGLTNYIEAEIAPKATGVRKFGVYFMLPYINNKVVEYVNEFKTFMPDIIDADNNINLDLLYSTSKSAVHRSGQFEFIGLIFNESDFDKLYTYIRQTA